MAKPRIGVVCGKFYPLHRGHHHLITTAMTKCEQLHIFLIYKNVGQNPGKVVRYSWLKNAYPQAIIHCVFDLPHFGDDNEWAKFFAGQTWEILHQFPNVVFSSELYGELWANAMGCKHVMVDVDRTTFPISGTQIRENPMQHINWIHPAARKWFEFEANGKRIETKYTGKDAPIKEICTWDVTKWDGKWE